MGIIRAELAPNVDRLGQIETWILVIKSDTTGIKIQMNTLKRRLDGIKDSVSTIRDTMTDMRDRQNSMIHDIQNLYRGQAEIRRDLQPIRDRHPVGA